uniref:Peroxisomal membrane protein 4 n=1 Tax=Macrostomum lignano TaxID=282301 RepID=A0A1I8F965_9PLAT
PQYSFAAELIKGIRNGIVYGCKIRFPHAVVMTFLFKSGPLSDKLSNIVCSVGKAFLAAFLAGYLVFGQSNKVNEQINLYLLSRILYGTAKLLVSASVGLLIRLAILSNYLPPSSGAACSVYSRIRKATLSLQRPSC